MYPLIYEISYKIKNFGTTIFNNDFMTLDSKCIPKFLQCYLQQLYDGVIGPDHLKRHYQNNSDIHDIIEQFDEVEYIITKALIDDYYVVIKLVLDVSTELYLIIRKKDFREAASDVFEEIHVTRPMQLITCSNHQIHTER